MTKFSFKSHDYFITEQSIDDLYVKIYREMCQKPLPGMVQPYRNNVFMGMDTKICVKIFGKPAIGYRWLLFSGENETQRGVLDADGVSRGLNMSLSNGLCKCTPRSFRGRFDPNGFLCTSDMPSYYIIIKEPLEDVSSLISLWLDDGGAALDIDDK